MISEKMLKVAQSSSVIRAMFEEGKQMAAEYGAENVYDFSLGNPSIPAPDAIGKGYEFPSSIEIIDKTFAAPSFTSLEQNNTLTGVFYKKMIEERGTV